jgi:hypothetical protein
MLGGELVGDGVLVHGMKGRSGREVEHDDIAEAVGMVVATTLLGVSV